MILLATAVFNLLSADPDVTALVGSGTEARIYPTLGRQGGVFPQIVWQEIVTVASQTHDDCQKLDRTDLQFSCYAETAIQAYQLRTYVRAALVEIGAMDGIKCINPVQRTFHDESIQRHNAILDLTFWYNPTASDDEDGGGGPPG